MSGDVSCGNARHPAGAWHPATPLPYPWQVVEWFRRWRNRRRWGCPCDRWPVVAP
jgi:hypothetical protein